MNKLNPGLATNLQCMMDQFDSINTSMQNRALAAAGLVIGSTSAAKVKIANTVTYLSAGVFKSKATAEVAFTATTHDIPNNASIVQEAKYLLSLDAAGTPTLTMGAVANTGLSVLPEIPAGLTPIGYVKIQVAAGGTKFTASTDLLSAGHLTVTYFDLGFIAPRFDSVQ
jgi:hypothetical protein